MKSLRWGFLTLGIAAFLNMNHANANVCCSEDPYFGSDCNFLDCCGCDSVVELDVGYLFWGFQEDYLGYAIEDINIIPTVPPTQTASKLKTHGSKWTSGVRIAAEVTNQNAPIGGRFSWTGFSLDSTSSVNSPSMLATVGISVASGDFGDNPFLVAQTASSKWKLRLNEFAFDVNYQGFTWSLFAIKPYVGVLIASINQSQNLFFTNISSNRTDFDADLSVKRHNKFWGVGPRLGLGMDWKICNNLNLFTDLNGAYLVGEFRSRNTLVGPVLAIGNTSITENLWRARPTIDGSLGFEWEQCCGNRIFTIAVAYEFQYWWKQWHGTSNIINDILTGEGNWGDLSMQGLVINAGITF